MDRQAWVSFYGYKNHVNVDQHHKRIRRYTVTDATVHDSQVIVPLILPPSAERDVWMDAAYRSQENDMHLRQRHLAHAFSAKATARPPLTVRQKASNQSGAQTRACVEQVFGHHGMARASKRLCTIGLVRARVKIGRRKLASNVHRPLRLMGSVLGQVASQEAQMRPRGQNQDANTGPSLAHGGTRCLLALFTKGKMSQPSRFLEVPPTH